MYFLCIGGKFEFERNCVSHVFFCRNIGIALVGSIYFEIATDSAVHFHRKFIDICRNFNIPFYYAAHMTEKELMFILFEISNHGITHAHTVFVVIGIVVFVNVRVADRQFSVGIAFCCLNGENCHVGGFATYRTAVIRHVGACTAYHFQCAEPYRLAAFGEISGNIIALLPFECAVRVAIRARRHTFFHYGGIFAVLFCQKLLVLAATCQCCNSKPYQGYIQFVHNLIYLVCESVFNPTTGHFHSCRPFYHSRCSRAKSVRAFGYSFP